jgi:hypothetical protein
MTAKGVEGDMKAPRPRTDVMPGAFGSVLGIVARIGRPQVTVTRSGLHVRPEQAVPDGQADPHNVGAAVGQVAIYILLLQELVARVGGKPQLVSTDALLITPRNTGLQPTLIEKSVSREIDRARRILDHVAPRRCDSRPHLR